MAAATAVPPAHRILKWRQVAGLGAFWISCIGVGAATFLVLALLAPHLASGGLAAVSAVLGLSYILAVPPGAIQLRATAAAAIPGPDLTLRPPRVALALALALLALSPVIASAVKIPIAAVMLGALQLPLSCSLGSVRGTFIGRKNLRSAGWSFTLDAVSRLAAGVGLGIPFGATGVAAALVIATLAPLGFIRVRPGALRSSAAGGTTAAFMIVITVLTVLTNADLLLAPRVLGSAADHYAAAALPAKGIFFVLFAVSELAAATTLDETNRRKLVAPAAAIFGLGLLGAGLLMAIRPLLPALLHRGEPSLIVLGPLALAMAAAGTTAIVVSMAVARGARRAWVGAVVAVVGLTAASLLLQLSQREFAFAVLIAQLIALGGGLSALLARPSAP